MTVKATDFVQSNSQTLTFTVNDTAPSVTTISPVTVAHHAAVPTVNLVVTDPDPDSSLRTFSVAVSGVNALPASPTVASNYGPLYDVRMQYGLTTPDQAAEPQCAPSKREIPAKRQWQ